MNENTYSKILNISNVNELSLFLGIDYLQLLSIANNPKYEKFKIKKKTGGHRIILAPSSTHKQFQKRINNMLQVAYNFNDPNCVYGFNSSQPEHIKANAQHHINKKNLLNIDIKDFFPSITSVMVRGMFMSLPFIYNEQLATLLAMLTTYNNMLPTGAPSSPIISNFIFIDADKQLLDLAKKYKLIYTRYADDLSFSSNNEITDEMIGNITKIIEGFGFKLNPKKYRLLNNYNRQTVTGITVNEKVNINRKYIRKIRAILHNIETQGVITASVRYFNLIEPDAIYASKLINSVRGKIEFIGFIRGRDDKIYTNFLNRILEFNEDTEIDYPF